MYHQANKKILAPFTSGTSGTSGTFKRRLKALDSSIARLPRNKVSRQRHPHRGFTLVELLVVIVIIAMLAALVTPAIMIAMSRAKVARIKAEIDMLHSAIMNYKNEYGSFPPSYSYLDPAPPPSSLTFQPPYKHLARLFPRCKVLINEFTEDTNLNGRLDTPRDANEDANLNNILDSAAPITPANAIVSWLGGYTSDPTKPLTGTGARKKLYDFDQSRVGTVSGSSGLSYFPPNAEGMPYLYIDAANYNSVDFATNGGKRVSGDRYFVWRRDESFDPNTLSPILSPMSLTAAGSPKPFNPDSFQIISAGRDGEFFTEDDISNMWSGTWGEWKDSN